MAKRYKKVSGFRTFLIMLFLLIVGVGVFVVGGKHPDEAQKVEKWAQEKADNVLERGKDAINKEGR